MTIQGRTSPGLNSANASNYTGKRSHHRLIDKPARLTIAL